MGETNGAVRSQSIGSCNVPQKSLDPPNSALFVCIYGTSPSLPPSPRPPQPAPHHPPPTTLPPPLTPPSPPPPRPPFWRQYGAWSHEVSPGPRRRPLWAPPSPETPSAPPCSWRNRNQRPPRHPPDPGLPRLTPRSLFSFSCLFFSFFHFSLLFFLFFPFSLLVTKPEFQKDGAPATSVPRGRWSGTPNPSEKSRAPGLLPSPLSLGRFGLWAFPTNSPPARAHTLRSSIRQGLMKSENTRKPVPVWFLFIYQWNPSTCQKGHLPQQFPNFNFDLLSGFRSIPKPTESKTIPTNRSPPPGSSSP